MIRRIVDKYSRDSFEVDDFQKIPCQDLHTINQLWLNSSQGHFGFTVQQQIYQEVQQDYLKVSKKIGWKVENNWISEDNLTFSLNAPSGHLPTSPTLELTICFGKIIWSSLDQKIAECKLTEK